MKYLITESQVESFLSQYIVKYRPELFGLSKSNLRYSDGTKYGYEFSSNEDFLLYFEYYFIRREDIEGEELPSLWIVPKLYNEFEGMFGNNNLDLIKKWFEKHYKLPVKSITKNRE